MFDLDFGAGNRDRFAVMDALLKRPAAISVVLSNQDSLTFGPSPLYFPSSAFLGRNFSSRTSSAKLASPESAHVLTLMAPVFVI